MNTRIGKIRNDKKLTQEEFAKKLNLSRNYISQVESGKKSPSDRTIADICREFNVNYEWLVYGTGEQYCNSDDYVHTLIDNILDGEDSVAKRAFHEFAKLDPSQWESLAKFMRAILKETKE